MEGPAVQSPRRERRRPSFHSPNSSRAVSRSSTRNSSARMPHQANNDSSSNVPPSPSLRYAQPVGSRFSHRRGSMGSNTDRPPTPVSKSSIRGSQSSSHQEPASTLLQEKLQRERRSEIQRNLSRLAADMNSPAADTQATASTPVRCATADGKRPESSDANGDTGRKKGLALKEMEQVLISPFHSHPATYSLLLISIVSWLSMSSIRSSSSLPRRRFIWGRLGPSLQTHWTGSFRRSC